MSDKDKPKFFFVSQNEAPGVRTAKINRHTALHLHAKRRRNQDAARHYFQSIDVAADNGMVQDQKVELVTGATGQSQTFQHRWRVGQPNTARQKKATRRARRAPILGEEDNVSQNSSSSSCSIPEVRPSSWSTELYPGFAIDSSKFRVLQYFLHYWMPSTRSMSRGCQITAFTPVWPGDRELSSSLLQQAFDLKNPVSVYSILTVGSRRMQIINGVSSGIDAPEIYTAKALAALREVIGSKTPPPARLTLDIAYLFLAEVYIQSSSNPKTYGCLLRDVIALQGGLHKLPSFIAQACLAYDNLMSASTLSPPALDPYRHPKLLFDPLTLSQMSEGKVMMEVFQIVQELEERPRIMATISHTYSKTMEALLHLPSYAQEIVRSTVKSSRFIVVGLIMAPLVTISDTPDSSSTKAVAAADGQYVHIKSHIFLIWLWSTALCCLRTPSERHEAAHHEPCCNTSIPSILKQVEKVIQVLQGTGWNVQSAVLVWFLAVSALSIKAGSVRDHILYQLRHTISNVGLRNSHDLDHLLHQSPSLALLLTSVDESSLWNFVMKQ